MDIVRAVLLVHREGIEDEPGKAPLVAARLGEIGHVRRQLAAKRGARGLVVRERRRESIGNLARALKHLALVVRTVGHLESGGDGGGLRLGESRAVGIGQIAERQEFQAVAVRANLAIDLKPALQLSGIVGAERAGKRPLQPRRRIRLLRGRHRRHGGERRRQREGQNDAAINFHWPGLLSRVRPAAVPMRRSARLRATPIPRSNSAAVWSFRTDPTAAG